MKIEFIICCIIMILFISSLNWCFNNMYEKDEKLKSKDVWLCLILSLFFWWWIGFIGLVQIIIRKTNGKTNGKTNR